LYHMPLKQFCVAVKMEAICSSEKSSCSRMTRYYTPEDCRLCDHCSEISEPVKFLISCLTIW
jgi:hypothetical protein